MIRKFSFQRCGVFLLIGSFLYSATLLVGWSVADEVGAKQQVAERTFSAAVPLREDTLDSTKVLGSAEKSMFRFSPTAGIDLRGYRLHERFGLCLIVDTNQKASVLTGGLPTDQEMLLAAVFIRNLIASREGLAIDFRLDQWVRKELSISDGQELPPKVQAVLDSIEAWQNEGRNQTGQASSRNDTPNAPE
ncbi:hypothetical protein [Novipirellula galeiformis]|nr:hypothetical protein [Novipirellula galeiformis]